MEGAGAVEEEGVDEGEGEGGEACRGIEAGVVGEGEGAGVDFDICFLAELRQEFFIL